MARRSRIPATQRRRVVGSGRRSQARGGQARDPSSFFTQPLGGSPDLCVRSSMRDVQATTWARMEEGLRMDRPIHSVEKEIAGRTLKIETGRMARQAAGAVTVRYGDTIVFVAVTVGPEVDQDFFPLTVDYRENTYAAGKFPGGFFKREGRPTTKETLTARLADRTNRPLFPKSYKR